LKFSDQTARNYMKVYEIREDKFKTVLNLNQVYQSLIEHKPKPKIEPEEDDVTNQRVRYKKCKPGFTKIFKDF